MEDQNNFINNIGRVCIYSAYLEEGVGELIDLADEFLKFEKEFKQYQLADRAKHLRKKLKKAYDIVIDYKGKTQDSMRISKLLKDIETAAKARGKMLHSIYISDPEGKLIQKTYSKEFPNNPPQETLITSQDAQKLYTKIWDLYSGILHAKPMIDKLKQALRS